MKKIAMILSLTTWICVQAANDVYEFANETQREQFTHLTKEIRCLVCQNQSIADSNAPFAEDLRAQVYKMVKQNQTDAQIKEYMSKRFGQYVLLSPPVSAQTVGLWLAPFGFLAVGITILISVISRKRRLRKLAGET